MGTDLLSAYKKPNAVPYQFHSWELERYKAYKFPVICENKLVDMSRIHPLAQAAVNRINEELGCDSRIKFIMLFGSSTNMRCNVDSDLDVCVCLEDAFYDNDTMNAISGTIQRATDYNADILWYNRIKNETIIEDISRGYRSYEQAVKASKTKPAQ